MVPVASLSLCLSYLETHAMTAVFKKMDLADTVRQNEMKISWGESVRNVTTVVVIQTMVE